MINETFCSKSWTDVNINFESRLVSHCCKAVPHSFPDKLTEDFISNNSFIIDRRLGSLQNIPHIDCNNCWNDYDKGNSAFREWANKWDSAFIQQTKDSLHDDRHTYYIEIRPDRTCDMSCIYCWSGNSSKIAQEEGVAVEDNTKEEDYIIFKQWIKSHIERSDLTQKELIFIFLGGEPTASERFYELVDYIETVSNGRAIRLEICTNANSKPFLMDKIIAKMDSSKLKWGIGISNESFGNDAELIRHGLDWTRFTNNFVRYIQHPKTELIVLSPTVNIFNLKSFPEYISWVYEQFRTHAPNKEFTWYGNFTSWPVELDIAGLPESYGKYLEQTKQVVLDNIESSNHVYSENFITFLDNMILRIGTAYNDNYKQDATQFLVRKQQVKKTDKLIKLMDNLDL
jgi:hypothetical protein